MKILHLADLHLGKSICGFSMIEDQRFIFEQVYDVMKDEKIEAVIFAGDVYDRSIPSADAIALLDEILTKISEMKVKVLIIPGNHDHAVRLGFANQLMKKSGIYILDTPQKITLQDEYGDLYFYMLPFERGDQAAVQLEDPSIKNCDDAVRSRIDGFEIDQNKRNILVAHHFVVSAKSYPEVSDSEIPLSVGGIDEVQAKWFDGFDYVALGHIHRPQMIGNEFIRYAGSILKYSFSEAGTDKYLTIIDIKEKGNVEILKRNLHPLHDMRKIKGTLKSLTAQNIVQLGDSEDYIHATLTDDLVLIEPMKTLKSVYPNIMQVAFERGTDREVTQESTIVDMQKQSVPELFESFYQYVTGTDLDQESRELMERVIDEAERINA